MTSALLPLQKWLYLRFTPFLVGPKVSLTAFSGRVLLRPLVYKELVFVRSPGENMGSNNDREHRVPEVVRHPWELEYLFILTQ